MPKKTCKCDVCKYKVSIPKETKGTQANRSKAERIPACCFGFEYFLTDEAKDCTMFWEFGAKE